MMEGPLEEPVESAQHLGRGSAPRGSAARQVVTFMPSRQLPYSTLRLRRTASSHNAQLEGAAGAEGAGGEEQADCIVRSLEHNQLLMEDNPEAEEMRRAALRSLPRGLTLKRDVRAKLRASVSRRARRRPLALPERLKYELGFAWKRCCAGARDLMFSIEPWHEQIRGIEGRYGSGCGSYFRMLRRLLALDAALAALLLLLLALPQALHDAVAVASPAPASAPPANWALDWITGKGGMTDSLMFFGHYSPGEVARGYSMPVAYLFAPTLAALAAFALLCYSTAYSYRRNFIFTRDALGHVFTNKVFCGWDFGITEPRAAALNSLNIYNEFKELLQEHNKKRTQLSWGARAGRALGNVLVTLLVLGGVGGALWGLWELRRRGWELALSALLAAGVALCPALFHAVGRLEWYGARTRLYVTLARTWLLHCGLLLMLLMSGARSQDECWETRFGQEAYRLVVLDSLLSLLALPAVEVARALLFKWWGVGAAPSFDLAHSSLALLYSQTALWFALLFAPLLAVVVVLRLLALFYVKRACLLHACQPARKVWRAAQTQTVLYMLVTLSLFATLFAVGSVFLRMPSTHCGPFRSYDYVYMVASEGVLGLAARPGLRAALQWAARPAVVALLLLLLCVLVYFMRARARAQRSMARLLRRMLALQAQDKDFLLAAIGRVSNGEWSYSPKDGAAGAEGEHTLRYLHEVRKPSNSSFQFDASRRRDPPTPGRAAPAPAPASDGDSDSSFSWRGRDPPQARD